MAKTKTRSRSPRRLPSESRRDQLVKAASAVIAKQGYADFSLDEVAERADVTRNLLYHYFPRGRQDLFLAAVHRGGEQLTADWATDPDVPLADRLAANFARMFEHARGATPAWQADRQARATADPAILAACRVYVDRIVGLVAQNHLGTDDPPPLQRIAIESYLAFAETAVAEAQARAVPEEELLGLLGRTLVAAIDAVR